MRPLRIPRALRRITREGVVNDGRCVRVRSALLVSAARGVRGHEAMFHSSRVHSSDIDPRGDNAREGALPKLSPGLAEGRARGTRTWRRFAAAEAAATKRSEVRLATGLPHGVNAMHTYTSI